MIRSKFDSETKIKKVRAPVLFIHGSRDGTVPIKLGRKLFDAANEPKEFYEIEGASHNDLPYMGGKRYLEKIRDFVVACCERGGQDR